MQYRFKEDKNNGQTNLQPRTSRQIQVDRYFRIPSLATSISSTKSSEPAGLIALLSSRVSTLVAALTMLGLALPAFLPEILFRPLAPLYISPQLLSRDSSGDSIAFDFGGAPRRRSRDSSESTILVVRTNSSTFVPGTSFDQRPWCCHRFVVGDDTCCHSRAIVFPFARHQCLLGLGPLLQRRI